MKYKLQTLLATALLSFSAFTIKAQTVSSFDSLSLPSAEIDFASTLTPDSAYTFQSGLVEFSGETNSWGSYSNFNFSNITDDTSQSYTNDKSAITGGGFNSSENYCIAFVPIDFMGPNPTLTIPITAVLKGNAINHPVAGAYFTNSTYAYYYMADSSFINANHWLQLTIRGYSGGQQSADSIAFMLADFRDTTNVLINDWKWVNLLPLGNVDSLTFDLTSDDAGSFGINVPAYFAMDNLITLEDNGPCPPPSNLMTSNKTSTSVAISWIGSTDTTTRYYYALDQSETLAPDSNNTSANLSLYTLETEMSFNSLTPNTTYYFHIQEVCHLLNGFAIHPWDTLSFTTSEANGIVFSNPNHLQFSISPNPATNSLSIHSNQFLNCVIFNLQGKIVLRAEDTKTINIADLIPGIYFLKAINKRGDKYGMVRFVKK